MKIIQFEAEKLRIASTLLNISEVMTLKLITVLSLPKRDVSHLPLWCTLLIY